ncbi:MAG: 50S ribosomal protein L9 [Dehalococcoidia bacterium]
MKVVFLQSVEGTATAGEVKDVKNGFARNFLLPRKLAAPAIEPYLQRAQARAKQEIKLQDELDRDAAGVAERIEGSRITLEARVGEQGKLYGSVTSVHIAEEVAKLLGGEEFDHRKVLLPEAIKEVGIQPVRLRLTRNVEATIEVEVLAEGEEPEDVAAEGELGEQPEAELESESSTEETAELEKAEAEASEESAEVGEGVAETEEEPA